MRRLFYFLAALVLGLGLAISVHAAGLTVPQGGTGLTGFPAGSIPIGPGTGSLALRLATSPVFLYGTSTDSLFIGTSTPILIPATLVLGTTTAQQIYLTGGAGVPGYAFRSVGGNLYIGTTSDLTGATSTSMSSLSLVASSTGTLFGHNISNPRATLDLYENQGFGASPSFLIGGNAGGDTDYWISRITNNDTTDNDSLQFGTTTIPGQASTLTLSNRGSLGIGSTTPYGMLSINPNGTLGPSLVIGSSTAAGTGTSFVVNNSGTTALYGTSATQFVIATNTLATTIPIFQVVANTAVQQTGVSVTSNTTGNGVTLTTLSTAANDDFNITSKGTGLVKLMTAGVSRFSVNASGASVSFTPGVLATASTVRFSQVCAADTTLTTVVEAPCVYFNMGQIRSHASGVINTQRDFRVTGTTHTFTAGTAPATAVIASSTTFSVDGPPAQGALLGSYTNAFAVYIGKGTTYTASTTFAAAISAESPVGATNVAVGTTSGKWFMHNLTVSGTGDSICFNTVTGEIVDGGGGTCTPSALKFKTDITPLGIDALAQIDQLKPVTFRYKDGVGDNGKQERIGLIADDVEKVNPNLVEYAQDGSIHGLHFEEFAGYFVKAFQQIIARLDGTDKRLDAQQKQIDDLKKELEALRK